MSVDLARDIGSQRALVRERIPVVFVNKRSQRGSENPAFFGTERLRAIPRKVRTDSGDAATLDQTIAGRQVGDFGVHRDDCAVFKKPFFCVLMIEVLSGLANSAQALSLFDQLRGAFL
jgi:hypothetical protein